MEPPQSKSSVELERRYVSHRLPYLSSQRFALKNLAPEIIDGQTAPHASRQKDCAMGIEPFA